MMMLPPPRGIMAGIAALTIRNAPVRLMRSTRSQVASSSSRTVAARSLSAAPYMSTSRPPKRWTAAATAFLQLAPSVTSRCTGRAWPPPVSISPAVALAPGSSTSAHATRAPAAAKARAVARPIPLAAATTVATFFSSLNVGSIMMASVYIARLDRRPSPVTIFGCALPPAAGATVYSDPAVRKRATVSTRVSIGGAQPRDDRRLVTTIWAQEDQRDAADPRTLRVLEHHEATRLHLARPAQAGRLRRAQHRGLRVRRRQGRRDRAARPSAEPQRLQLARLRQPRRHLAALRAAR